VMRRNACRWLGVVSALAGCAPAPAAEPDTAPLIGYTELRTNLSGGRHANVRTMRAAVVKADGTGRKRSCLFSEADIFAFGRIGY